VAGQEVLLVDADRSVLRLLEKLLTEAGLTVTALENPWRARDQVEKRFIPVVLCDLDIPYAGGGIELVQFARQKSPLTSVILMTSRQGYEAVAPAFRAGAHDVVPKTHDAIEYIRDRVVEAALELRKTDTREQLLADVAEMHEEFLRKMMELSRQVTDLEDKLAARDGAPPISSIPEIMNVLLVDHDPGLDAVIARALLADTGWRICHAQTGGQALDAASQLPPHIVVINESLPDLPSTMVIKSIKTRNTDAVVLVFKPPTEGQAGEVRMVDGSKLHTLIPTFSSPDQMVTQIEEVRDALQRKARERRYLQAFRKHHLEFLQRYHQLKDRLAPKPPT
jgi:DNA-binding NtrC family response regulator